jgi:hypothetical protein
MKAQISYRLKCVVAMAFGLLASANAQVSSFPSSPNPKISSLSADMRAAMTGKSWKPGCPIPLDDLAAVQVTYFGFDGLTHEGTLVVHKRFAADASKIFQELYAIRFPINKVSPWENYGPDIYAEQNITVGFYCEKADDAPTEWSSHAYGIAVDVNPLDNPFRDANKGWWPKVSAAVALRDDGRGKVSPNTEAFRIFARHGWAWGGFFAGDPDYMHFYKLTAPAGGNPLDRPYAATELQYIPGGVQEAVQPK